MREQRISDRYKIEGIIGRGGMGHVYTAVDERTGQPVAIKALEPSISGHDPAAIERFLREGEALRKLHHPNIVQIYDLIEDSDTYYIIMEYVAGGTLATYLRKEGPLPIKSVISIGLELADALTRAHHLNIIHRDIKPANILLAGDGTPRLTDFGVARIGESEITQEGAVIGTIAYMSPEGCRGEPIDKQSDIWSYGVVLYEMITGERPYYEPEPVSLLNTIVRQPVPPIEERRPDTPVPLVDLIYRMLEKNPDARIPSMRQVAAELEAIMRLDGDTSVTSPPLILATPHPEIEMPSTVTPVRVQRHNLPAATTAFFGRKSLIREITDLLSRETQRFINLTGMGGIGKTRLALEVAYRVIDLFVDGVYYIPVEDDSEGLVAAIGDALLMNFSGEEHPFKELVAHLHTKQVLLLLDGLETLQDQDWLIQEILVQAPGVKILGTSRQRMRLQGEYVIDVPPFRVPPPKLLPTDLRKYPAIQLFLESAARVTTAITLHEGNMPHVRRIIELVEGLPLAIQLAAAWLEMLTLAEIETEIAQSYDFLQTDLRDLPQRHRSVRAIFEYSWNNMTVEERDVFMKLSVFEGGFERDPARKITGASLRNLMTLVNKSLLRRTPEGRFSVQPLLKDYAAERFEVFSDDFESTHRAHARYFTGIVNKAVPYFESRKAHRAIKRLDEELGNIRAALEWNVQYEHWDMVKTMLHGLTLYFQIRGVVREGVALMSALLDRLNPQQDLYWHVTLRRAWLALRIEDSTTTYRVAHECLQHFEQTDNAFEISLALNLMAHANIMQGKLREALDLANRSLDTANNNDSSTVQFLSLQNLGLAAYMSGDFNAAHRIYSDLVAMYESGRLATTSGAHSYNHLGEVLLATGRILQAKDRFEQALSIFELRGHSRGKAVVLINLGHVSYLQGDFAQARQYYADAYALSDRAGDRATMAQALIALGQVAFIGRDDDRALQAYRHACQIRRELGDKHSLVRTLNQLGMVSLAHQDTDTALTHFKESAMLLTEVEDQIGLIDTLTYLSYGYNLHGDPSGAEQRLDDAQALAEGLQNAMMRTQVNLVRADLAIDNGDLDAALDLLHAIPLDGEDAAADAQRIYMLVIWAKIQSERGNAELASKVIKAVLGAPVQDIQLGHVSARRLDEKLPVKSAENTLSVAQMFEQVRQVNFS